MNRLTLILVLFLVAGCESPSSRQAYRDWYSGWQQSEQKRLREVYRKVFEDGFVAAWQGRGGIPEFGLVDSTDPDGDFARSEGWMDGQRAGKKAKLAFELEQVEKVKH